MNPANRGEKETKGTVDGGIAKGIEIGRRETFAGQNLGVTRIIVEGEVMIIGLGIVVGLARDQGRLHGTLLGGERKMMVEDEDRAHGVEKGGLGIRREKSKHHNIAVNFNGWNTHLYDGVCCGRLWR